MVGRIRISQQTEESTSVERQQEMIRKWCDMHGHTLVGWAEDISVSGSLSPFETKGLGPWLTVERVDDYDALVAWKLDRFGRRAIPLNALFGFCMDHKKTLVCISDNIDLSTWVGRLVANVLAGVAEGELEAIQERVKSSREKLLRDGRFAGGAIPYGFEKYKADVGWKLRPHPEQSKTILKMVSLVLSGMSVSEVAHTLTEESVPTSKGKSKRWDSVTVWQILTKRLLLGHATKDNQTCRDEDGEPIYLSDPILSIETWDQLQTALDARRLPQATQTRKPSRLLDVAKCMDCGNNYSIRQHTKNDHVYRYYWCRGDHPKAHIKADVLENLLEETFLSEWGHLPVKEKVYIPATNNGMELSAAKSAIEDLSGMLVGLNSTAAREPVMRQIATLDEKITRLEKTPSRPASFEWRPTGKTYSQVWVASEWPERRQLLLKSDITVHARNINALEFHLYVPAEITMSNNVKTPPMV
ncbi:recombinase family protein [Nocardia sp. R6R-6]|uniref:recombinase family protein n=1 Tax=Nocardia sp. R6R-6 TaxID=3459303 RepID=UPI00403DFE2B